MKSINYGILLMIFIMLILACDDIIDPIHVESGMDVQMEKMSDACNAKIKDGDASRQILANELYTYLLKRIGRDDKEYKFSKRYPNYYGGAYITEEGRLVILLKNGIGRDTIGKILRNDKIVDYKDCKYSYQELLDFMHYLDEQIELLPPNIQKNLKMYYIDDRNNRIVVGLVNDDASLIDELRSSVIDFPAVVYVKVHMMLDSGPMPNPIDMTGDMDLKPGGFISRKIGESTYGSMAFRARFVNDTSTVGMVTAGHLLSDSAFYHSYYIGIAYPKQVAGSMDAAFVEVDENPRPSLQRIAFHPLNIMEFDMSMINPPDTLVVTLSTDVIVPGVGTIINKRGYRTGRTTGVVLSTCYSGVLTISQSNTIHVHDMMAATYYSDFGDSGGIVYTYYSLTGVRATVGVHSASYCDSVNNRHISVFSKADNILNVFGLERY
ncbi:MAG: hypothetical protein IJ176_08885 [Prevotella sp.]|nr:hypothetical protein [Prevotella sp.]